MPDDITGLAVMVALFATIGAMFISLGTRWLVPHRRALICCTDVAVSYGIQLTGAVLIAAATTTPMPVVVIVGVLGLGFFSIGTSLVCRPLRESDR